MMEGRWTIGPGGYHVALNDDDPHDLSYILWHVDGPESRVAVPVVPCDDAAVERAVQALAGSMASYADSWREVVEIVFDAARETP